MGKKQRKRAIKATARVIAEADARLAEAKSMAEDAAKVPDGRHRPATESERAELIMRFPEIVGRSPWECTGCPVYNVVVTLAGAPRETCARCGCYNWRPWRGDVISPTTLCVARKTGG